MVMVIMLAEVSLWLVQTLEGESTQKWKFNHFVFTLMLMEGQVKFFIPQKVSQEKDVAIISQTIKVKGDYSQLVCISLYLTHT